MAYSFKSFVAEQFKTLRKENKELKELLLLTIQNLQKIMADLKKLEDAVAKETGIVQSAITLIKGIAQQLQDAKGDEVKVNALADKLNSDADALAAAVAANTPATEQPA